MAEDQKGLFSDLLIKWKNVEAGEGYRSKKYPVESKLHTQAQF